MSIKSTRKVIALLVLVMVIGVAFVGVESTTRAADKTVNLGFFHWKGEEAAAWNKIIALFEAQNPGIKVNMEITTLDNFYVALKPRILAGEGLDVFAINAGSRFKEYVAADAFMDLAGQPFLKGLNKSLLEAGQADGKQDIIPLSKNFSGLFYNKKIFRKYHLQVPKTWDDFLKVCETLKKNGVDPIGCGLADRFTATWPIEDMLVQYSDDPNIYPKLASGQMKFTDPVYKDSLKPLSILAQKGYWQKGAAGTGYEPSLALFASERVAMLNSGTWSIGALRQANPNLEMGYMLFPSPNGKFRAGIAPSHCLAIYKKTKNKEAALKFLSFVFSQKIMELFGNQTGQEVINVAANARLKDKDLVSIAKVGNAGSYPPILYQHYNSNVSKIDQDIVAEMTAKVIMGEDVDQAMKEAQQALEALDLKKQ